MISLRGASMSAGRTQRRDFALLLASATFCLATALATFALAFATFAWDLAWPRVAFTWVLVCRTAFSHGPAFLRLRRRHAHTAKASAASPASPEPDRRATGLASSEVTASC